MFGLGILYQATDEIQISELIARWEPVNMEQVNDLFEQ